ncbi:MAG: M42 family metallopeptidase [Armatimonadota bacterium]|nr:M42 family metallopeptidase [Armatimonadota bacterium]MCX7777031.1 M42 family metallopeptidase [Armatimonadota bacterium]MDW8024901.1 M42 family metallopeptidase [Armatimonadota bacterium]
MRSESLEFLRALLETPSPSGYEEPVQGIVMEWASKYAEDVQKDVHGNVIAKLNPSGYPRVMLAGHCDQIGLMVQHIDESGYLYVSTIGGFDVAVLIGQRVVVWSKKGDKLAPVHGVIARKPIHLLPQAERERLPRISELWIDIGARSKREAERFVSIGDPVTFELKFQLLRNNAFCACGLDDKVGTWVVMETLRILSGKKFDAAVFAVSTVQEELGLRGARTSAFGIEPHVGIAVDVTFASDHPEVDRKQIGEIRLHRGPVIYRGPNINPKVFEMLVNVARRKGIPYQLAGAARATGTDANAIQVTRAGVATGLISIPNRYMHSPVEVASLSDLENAARLLASFVQEIRRDINFIP